MTAPTPECIADPSRPCHIDLGGHGPREVHDHPRANPAAHGEAIEALCMVIHRRVYGHKSDECEPCCTDPVYEFATEARAVLTTTDPAAQSALAASLPAEVMLAALDWEWAVYEARDGKVWTCDPPTMENARREAELAGPGHEAIPRHWAKAMANAWCHGRMAGIESMREATP